MILSKEIMFKIVCVICRAQAQWKCN